MYDFLIDPFVQYSFLKRGLAACLGLSLGCAPIGVLIVLRRMSLMGDALSHSALPGVAIGYIIAGLSLPAMSLGGFIAGLLVAILSGVVSRSTVLKEDATLVGFYLIALAVGVVIVSVNGSQIDLLHILLGSVLAVDQGSLLLIASVSTVSLLNLAIIYRPLLLECCDPVFMKSIKGKGSFYHLNFVILVVMNMVAALHAMGTLLALGMMMLPAITARFWVRQVWTLFLVATGVSIVSAYLGLILSYHYALPSGPAIVLVAGVFYIISLFIGRIGSLKRAYIC